MEGPQTTWEPHWHTLNWEGQSKCQVAGESKPDLRTWPGSVPLLPASGRFSGNVNMSLTQVGAPQFHCIQP